MQVESPDAFVRRYLKEVFTGGNFAAIDEFAANEDFKEHALGLAKRWRNAFPDLHIEVDGVIAENDRVVTEELMTGTHLGTYESDYLGAIPATGKTFKWSRIAIRDLAEGKFSHGYWEGEELELLDQLGVKVAVQR